MKTSVRVLTIFTVSVFLGSCSTGQSVPATSSTSSTFPVPIAERLIDWKLEKSTELDSSLRSMAISSLDVLPASLKENPPENALEQYSSGYFVQSYKTLLAQQCEEIKSPFDFVRSSSGEAPSIAKFVHFQNWETGKPGKGVKLWGDLVVFDKGTALDIEENFDRIISQTGSSCEVQYYSQEDSSLKCWTYEPEMIWDYQCARKAWANTYDDQRTFTTVLALDQRKDTNGNIFPLAVLFSLQEKTGSESSGMLIKSALYGFNENLNTTFNLNIVSFVDDGSFDAATELENIVSKAGAEIIKYFQNAMDTKK